MSGNLTLIWKVMIRDVNIKRNSSLSSVAEQDRAFVLCVIVGRHNQAIVAV